MKILVTGGAGYIGSHACKALAASGFEPITYDNLSRGNRWSVQWGPFEEGDIAHTGRLMEVLRHHRPAAVMHFAAFAYVGESVDHPLMYYRNNIAGSLSLLTALVETGVIPLVFSSTCATYGIPERVPILETDPQRPINPYGFSKLSVERMLADAGQAHGLRSISLRYFNAAGADQDGQIGEAHEPETHLVPRVLQAAASGGTVEVYGNDYPTHDGTCVRDYVHVSDIADAHVLGLKHLLSARKSGVFNLANVRGYSVLEVIAAAERVTGERIKVKIAGRRPGDPPELVGSAAAARQALGWNPAKSDIETQVRDAWSWMQTGLTSPARAST